MGISVKWQIVSGLIAIFGIWFVLPWDINIKLIVTLVIIFATCLKIFIIKKTIKNKEPGKMEEEQK